MIWKHMFTIRANYGHIPMFDSYLCQQWADCYEGMDYEAFQALNALSRAVDHEGTDDYGKMHRDVLNFCEAMPRLHMRVRLNNDMRGPFICTIRADYEFHMADKPWAGIFWDKRASRVYDLTAVKPIEGADPGAWEAACLIKGEPTVIGDAP